MALRLADGFDPALEQRVVSSLVLAAGALVAVLVGGWVFTALVLASLVVMAGEWGRLLPDSLTADRRLVWGIIVLLSAGAVLTMESGRADIALLVILLGPPLVAALAALAPKIPPDRAAGGVVYVGLPALSLVWLRNEAPGGFQHVLWLLLVVWSTDIAAYFTGRAIGGSKLAPRISPGKTWAGLAGGLVGAGLAGGLVALAFGAGFWFAALSGAALAVVAQIGDLFESLLKRRAGLKDSGHLIPGHGGLLDRIDGLVFVAPVFAGAVWLFGRVVAS
jgi:phosphatidate cytidylyltransferase